LKNAMETSDLRRRLAEGLVIPALPLALDNQRQWDKRYQAALLRYYMDAGVGGIAVGVHSTQFEIREPEHGLYEPLLKFASQEMDRWRGAMHSAPIKIAGICGRTPQAIAEARGALESGYHAGLLSLAAFRGASEGEMLDHCRAVGELIPLVGFYLQPAAGGRLLPYSFWREFAEIPSVVAVKIAPFNRYQTWDVVRAVMESNREDIALYTGNDDNIIADLLTPWEINGRQRYIAGGLLGQFGVWTKKAVELLDEIKAARTQQHISTNWLTRNAALTDVNAAVFDAANGFAGVLPGIHEILRRQGLLPNRLTLKEGEDLSPGQARELDRVTHAYPWLVDDAFVQDNLSRWLHA
jgi:dihydrodipicolinate synthase/N-acetylneuraminate lyase